jgi:ABC-type multidrug transport system ATPase subunit
VIETIALAKQYGTSAFGRRRVIDALRDVSIEIASGETVAVVGPNGAGKSTLFGIILGFLRPTSGRVRIAGVEPRAWIRRNGAGYMPERFALPGSWRLIDAVVAFARLDSVREDVRARAVAALDQFGLAAYADRRIATLSRGLLQRLGLVQATIAQRQVVVLDEPTAGLDPVGRRILRETLTTLRARGSTILLASQELAEVERTADRVVLLDGGSVRDVLAARVPVDPKIYMLRVDAAAAALQAVFPDAIEAGAGEFEVTVNDAVELSARLATLVSAGGVVHEVRPRTEPLEERVTRALGNDTDDHETAGPAGRPA